MTVQTITILRSRTGSVLFFSLAKARCSILGRECLLNRPSFHPGSVMLPT